jgi:hypothetical protein
VLDLAVTTSDDPVRPDQYRYVASRAWRLGSFATPTTVHNHLTEHVERHWVPGRPELDWLLERGLTGRQIWLTGSAEEAREAGFDPCDTFPSGRFRAPFGDFYAELNDAPPRPPSGGWATPTAAFLAGLPRDPQALAARLRADSDGRRYRGPFTCAIDALRTGLVPADLRAALYRALALLPAVTVAADAADTDGKACVALVHDDGPTRTEMFVDPDGGRFVGERDTLRRDARCGLPAGTVITATSVRTAVVNGLGELPPG